MAEYKLTITVKKKFEVTAEGEKEAREAGWLIAQNFDGEVVSVDVEEN